LESSWRWAWVESHGSWLGRCQQRGRCRWTRAEQSREKRSKASTAQVGSRVPSSIWRCVRRPVGRNRLMRHRGTDAGARGPRPYPAASSSDDVPGQGQHHRQLAGFLGHPRPRSNLERGYARHGCRQRKGPGVTARSGACLQRRVDHCPKGAFLKALRALLGERLHRGRSRIPPWQRRQGPWASWVSLSLS
jgi:hypothetical protein